MNWPDVEGSNPSRTFQRNAISGKIIYVTPFYWYPERFQWLKRSSVLDTGTEMAGSIPASGIYERLVD